jgi:lathosterol oxidase
MSRRPWSVHRAIDAAVPVLLTAAGLWHESPRVFFTSLLACFAVLATLVVGGAGLFYQLTRTRGARIQGPRKKPPPIGREAFETTRAMYVASCLAAWPIAQSRLGHPIGLVWSLAETELHPLRLVLQTFAGVVAIDAWLYLKHRLLHTRLLFGFHKAHHAFRDPTPFAGFAVAPVEAVMTFWPILALSVPAATHWAPLYFPLIGGFILLNLYLHCGVTFRWVEALLSPLLLNTSAFHNIHHSHVNANYGEPSWLWDWVFRTRLQDRELATSARSA